MRGPRPGRRWTGRTRHKPVARKRGGGAKPPSATPEKRRYKAFAAWPELLPAPDAVFASHDSDPADIAAQATRRQIEDWRGLFKKQKNPLYAWLAIAYSFAHEAPLPEWCLEYIKTCSFEIYVLMQLVCGRDFVIDLSAKGPSGTMRPDEAKKHLAAALQITNGGGNAFKQLLSDAENMRAYAAKRLAKDIKRLSAAFPPINGAYDDAPAKALEAIQARHCITDRQAKNRVKAGRELLQWPDAPVPKRKKPNP